ncbi:MAG: pilus assembly protein [Anaerolineae bacterium]|nr:pilus assembly protein [Anaerolineae bacterium]
MKRLLKRNKFSGYHAQAMVEFAIALPILMALLVGILEVGRMVFIYAAVTNASREASRYGSAVGLNDSGTTPKYQDCDGIKEMARRSAYFLALADGDIVISYDHGPGTGSFDTCTSNVDTGVVVNSGSDPDRVIVTVSATYSPMVNLVPISSRPITSSSARTILGILDMTTGNSVVPTTGSSNTATATLPSTAVPTDTSTAIATVTSDTPTATEPGGDLITFTPLPTSTATDTPTVTPTFTETLTPTTTFTPTMTFTPTSTSTPVPGCDSITAGAISITGGNKIMSMTITNPHDSITILNIQVTWNHDTGGTGNPKTLALKSASLVGTFWTWTNDNIGAPGPSITITPSTTVIIPGNNVTTPIIFTFDKNYQITDGTESIVINLSTPGCESFPIQRP